MNFNLKYLMLPLSIMACINNNGNCMSEQYFIDTNFIDTNQQNIINDDTNDGILAADLIEIMKSFENENTENLGENTKNFIIQLARHSMEYNCKNFENKILDEKMFDNLFENNKKLNWDLIFSYLYAGALKKYDVDYSKAYPNFLKSIRACCDTEEQYNKLLDNLIQLSYNLLRYNLKKYFDGFNNGYSYRKKFYKVFNFDDNSKYDNSIFRVTKKVFNDYYRETFGFIKEIVDGLVLLYIYKNRSNEEKSYVDQIRQTTQEYIMKLVQYIACYENDKEENNNTNIDAQVSFVVEEIKKQVEIFYYKRNYRELFKTMFKYNKKRLKDNQEEIPPIDIIGDSGILRFIERNKFQRIISVGNSIKEIKSKDNYCVYGFSKYIEDIIKCYKDDFPGLIKNLLDSTKITSEMKNELTEVLGIIAVNENTTIKDLLENKEITSKMKDKLTEILNKNTTIKDLLENKELTDKMKEYLINELSKIIYVKYLLREDKQEITAGMRYKLNNILKKYKEYGDVDVVTIEMLLKNKEITEEMKDELTKISSKYITVKDLLKTLGITVGMDPELIKILENNNINENTTIKDLLKNKEITVEIKDELTKILRKDDININENTTIKDLIDKQQKLLQCATLLNEYKQKLNEENTQKLKKNLDEIIDIINVLTEFVYKIDRKDPKIMDFTLEQLKGTEKKVEATDKDKAKNEIKEETKDEIKEKEDNNTNQNKQNDFLNQID